MTSERFLKFTQIIDALQKTVQRIKIDYAPKFGVKSIHLFWMCELLNHPDGLTPSMLAKNVSIDRSLISREIRYLEKRGYIERTITLGKRSYNSPLRLTESGAEIARSINREATEIQNFVDLGLKESELESFYEIANKLLENLTAVKPVSADANE